MKQRNNYYRVCSWFSTAPTYLHLMKGTSCGKKHIHFFLHWLLTSALIDLTKGEACYCLLRIIKWRAQRALEAVWWEISKLNTLQLGTGLRSSLACCGGEAVTCVGSSSCNAPHPLKHQTSSVPTGAAYLIMCCACCTLDDQWKGEFQVTPQATELSKKSSSQWERIMRWCNVNQFANDLFFVQRSTRHAFFILLDD